MNVPAFHQDPKRGFCGLLLFFFAVQSDIRLFIDLRFEHSKHCFAANQLAFEELSYLMVLNK
jgi:hypothetical protein